MTEQTLQEFKTQALPLIEQTLNEIAQFLSIGLKNQGRSLAQFSEDSFARLFQYIIYSKQQNKLTIVSKNVSEQLAKRSKKYNDLLFTKCDNKTDDGYMDHVLEFGENLRVVIEFKVHRVHNNIYKYKVISMCNFAKKYLKVEPGIMSYQYFEKRVNNLTLFEWKELLRLHERCVEKFSYKSEQKQKMITVNNHTLSQKLYDAFVQSHSYDVDDKSNRINMHIVLVGKCIFYHFIPHESGVKILDKYLKRGAEALHFDLFQKPTNEIFIKLGIEEEWFKVYRIVHICYPTYEELHLLTHGLM